MTEVGREAYDALRAEQEGYREYVARMLRQAIDSLCMVAEGDYTARCTSERDDDFSTLFMTVNMLINSVRTTVEELEARRKESERALQETAASLEVIEQQRSAIRELSTPVLQLWDDVIALPIIGIVDSGRAADIMERLLEEITARQAHFVIIDVTGVEIVDTRTADQFLKVVQAAQLLGSRCFITGIRPAVAQTLVGIGVDLSSVATLRTLRDGLRECLREMHGRSDPFAGTR